MQNQHQDVVALADADGAQMEMVRYRSFGMPFGLPGGDCDSDGTCDSQGTTDTDLIQGWINSSAYDVRGDMDLDGDVDANDKTVAAASPFAGNALAWDALSSVENFRAMGGSHGSAGGQMLIHQRARVMDTVAGRWLTRDALEYVDGANLYEYVRSNPIVLLDPDGKYSVDRHGYREPPPPPPPEWFCSTNITWCMIYSMMRPQPATKEFCNRYGLCDEYLGANSRCFCKCAGNSRWSNIVRSCLMCYHRRGVDKVTAHLDCYRWASQFADPPYPLLADCYAECAEYQAWACWLSFGIGAAFGAYLEG